MLVALVVVDVSGKDDDAEGRMSLALLQHFREGLFGGARRVSAAVKSAGEQSADVTRAARNDDLHDEFTAMPGGA